ncbi:NAD(P)-dependent oxidoreductase [Actinomycetospora sp. TBRC 11914]|uniref:NAD(P)-dependent oxidoreductase n=1 Tax=Actinomycetospora sp. TBRC 11914 TaxID=2729387 RepID=UPI00145D0354|nr:NAD(P)-dependent oxidoreductase [Actinomycetospora sp. TBRC 11914]NMO88426.1 NAD(P)-dependent oxidoreductase [Actinomycetospora sp. TBRC 11914]
MTGPVGFVGLGNMGGRMARRLVAAGTPVVGHDPVAGRAEAAGAAPAADPAAVARACRVVLLSLPDSGVVEPVVRGPDGVLAGAAPGSTVVDLSTADPSSTAALAREAAAQGVTFLDAGISGGAAAAEKGTLIITAGGDPEAVDAVRPVLAAFAATVHHLGPVGAGHTAKLLNNFLNAVTLAATAEVMVAGTRAGLDLRTLLAAINGGSGQSFASVNRFPRIVEGDYLEGGLTTRLMTKDVTLYTELLGRLGVPSLNAAGPLASFGLAAHLGYGDVISNRVVDALGDLAGGTRIQQSRHTRHDRPDQEG